MFEYGVGKLAMTELIGAISACFIIESSTLNLSYI